MRKTVVFSVLIVLLAGGLTWAEQPGWEELDSRPVPQWWRDAKFGIFIHWGPYSVPAFSRVGDYSEWYWMDLVNTGRRGHKTVRAFHDANYGTGFTYPDFVPDFTCELFDPAQWADVFKDSGAKYVVLTSKHHDGYCLWPSKEADASWGRPWNSTTCGPESKRGSCLFSFYRCWRRRNTPTMPVPRAPRRMAPGAGIVLMVILSIPVPTSAPLESPSSHPSTKVRSAERML